MFHMSGSPRELLPYHARTERFFANFEREFANKAEFIAFARGRDDLLQAHIRDKQSSRSRFIIVEPDGSISE